MSTATLMEPVPGVQPTRSGLYLWRYPPNVGAAALFLVLFMSSFLYISWRIWKTRARFCIVFNIGCFLEMVGYGVRAGARNKTGKLMPFVVQNMFVLVAPVLFAASIYMCLGRIINSIQGGKRSLIRPSKITTTFVLGDVVSFIIQGGGAGLSVVQKAGLAKWAERIIVIGLLVQIIMFALFCILALSFHRKMRHAHTTRFQSTSAPWESGLRMLYAVSLLIMVRSIFRVVEYCQGQTGYALSHEWALYVFDSLLMFIVTVVFAWKFPSQFDSKHHEQSNCVEMVN